MPKPADRPLSRSSREAIALLGRLVRAGRIDRRMTAEELARRAGLSRALLQRIEKGDAGCSIGAVFEAAAIAGVPLFQAEPRGLAGRIADVEERLTLLPKSVRRRPLVVDDDF